MASMILNANGPGLLQQFLDNQVFWANVIRAVLIVLITWMAAKAYRKIALRFPNNNKIHFRFLNSIVIVVIYFAGALIALFQFPDMDKAFSSLMAGSGIAALTIGLAAQESLGNAINGVFLSASKPIEVGDRIHLVNSNITGYVEDITLRHTVIRTFINSRIIIPNSVISKELIENSNFQSARASSFVDVVITYDSNMAAAQQIMATAVEEHPDFVDTRSPDQMNQPKTKVYVRNLGLYGVELRVSMWTKDIGVNFDACSDVRQRIKQEFDEAGIRFANLPFPAPQ